MKTIIYYRKSTDTDDKQQNSLEHQLNNCRKTAELNNLVIYKEIWESKSAKTEFTREWFNEMIKHAKLGRVDYIICDEPKRLSRNNLDTSRIIDLLDKKQIKGILCTSREYHGENSRDKFLLQLDLSLSKMDNEDRAKDTKDKMITAFKKGQWLGKAPPWYKNITLKKWHKSIEVDLEKVPFIKRAFELRTMWYSLNKLREYLFENWVHNRTWNRYSIEQVKKILKNKFYIWIMEWWWLENKWNHSPIISESLFYQASWKKPKTETIYTLRKWKFNFTWLLRWQEENLAMSWYQKKWHIYYQAWFNSKVKINISEKLLFEKIRELFKPFENIPEPIQKITKEMLQDIYNKATNQKEQDLEKIKNKILKLKERKDTLINAFLDWDIEKEIYKSKKTNIEQEIIDLEKNIIWVTKISSKFHNTINKHSELILSLYRSYPSLTNDEKIWIINSLKMYFIVNSKKELCIANNSPYKTLENLFLHKWHPH